MHLKTVWFQSTARFRSILWFIQVDVGVIDDIQFGNPTSPRFVYWDKKLRATPSGPDVLTFDLLSIGGKLRAGMGLLGLRPKMPG